MDESKITEFKMRELTKEDWKEVVDILNKKGELKNPLDGMTLQQKKLFDEAIKRQFGNDLQFPKDNSIK